MKKEHKRTYVLSPIVIPIYLWYDNSMEERMMTAHILVVEDDKATRTAIVSQLQYTGYHVTQASDGETALTLLETHLFDVVITDIIMYQVDGIAILQTARMQAYHPEVILLTGYGSLDTAMIALRQGAFDYLQKPCPTDQLLACVQSAIHRHASQQKMRQAVTMLSTSSENNRINKELLPPSIHIGALTIGPSRTEVFFHGQPIQVTPIEYAILSYLAIRKGHVCPCQDIVLHTHHLETNEEHAQRVVRSHISNLRKKFGAAYLISKRGYGYMLIDPHT